MSGSHENLYVEIHQNPAVVDEVINSNNNNDLMALVFLLPRLPQAQEIANKLVMAKSAFVRKALVEYLHRFNPSYELIWSLANDEDGNVRWAVSKEVSKIPFGAEIAEYMVSYESSEHCRWSIAKQLDMLSNGEELALKLIEDPEIFVREQVFKELHKLNNGLELAKRTAQGDVQHDRLMLASNVNTFPNPEELDSMLRESTVMGGFAAHSTTSVPYVNV